jgi:hypothetical protein
MIVIYKLFVISGLRQVLIEDLLPTIKNLWLQLEMIVISPPSLEEWQGNTLTKNNITYKKLIWIVGGNNYTHIIYTLDHKQPISYYTNNLIIRVTVDNIRLNFSKLYYNKKLFDCCNTAHQIVPFYYFHCK